MKSNSKSVLLISCYFAPYNIVGAKRFSYLSDHLVKNGIDTHVLTIKEKYIPKKDDTLISNGIIHRTSLFPAYPFPYKKLNIIFKPFFNFIDQYIGWFLPGILKGLRIIKRYKIDTVIVTLPPFSSCLIPYFLSFFYKFNFIIDYRDPSKLYRKSSFGEKFVWFIEKKILSKANKVIFNTNKAQKAYCKLKPDIVTKSSVISNGFFESSKIEPKRLDNERKVITYAGNFYGNRTVYPLIEALIKLSENSGIPCTTLHIFGKISTKDLEKIKSLNTLYGKIVEHENVNQHTLFQYLSGSDVLYITQGKDHEYSVPYKLIDYLSVRKPVLAYTSKNSATQEMIEDTNCGELAFLDEPESLYLALKKILLKENEYSFIGTEKYSYKTVADKFLNIILNSI